MEIATVLCVHDKPDMAKDVLDSVRLWATRNIVLVVDGAGWHHYKNFSYPNTHVLQGFYHGARRSPYKNWIAGMCEAYRLWPDMDWYNYIEYDALYLNSHFKQDLWRRQEEGFAFVGFNHERRLGGDDHWLAKEILGEEAGGLECHKVLGAVTFFAGSTFKRLSEFGFFEEVLKRTADFKGDEFPNFVDYAVEEILFPSAASLFGQVGNLSETNSDSPRYAVRFASVIDPNEISADTSILHPVKKPNGVIHKHYRKTRAVFLEE